MAYFWLSVKFHFTKKNNLIKVTSVTWLGLNCNDKCYTYNTKGLIIQFQRKQMSSYWFVWEYLDGLFKVRSWNDLSKLMILYSFLNDLQKFERFQKLTRQKLLNIWGIQTSDYVIRCKQLMLTLTLAKLPIL